MQWQRRAVFTRSDSAMCAILGGGEWRGAGRRLCSAGSTAAELSCTARGATTQHPAGRAAECPANRHCLRRPAGDSGRSDTGAPLWPASYARNDGAQAAAVSPLRPRVRTRPAEPALEVPPGRRCDIQQWDAY